MLTLEEARERILAEIEVGPREHVGLTRTVGRVLAAPVAARCPQPAFDNSAMDGYAVRARDVAEARHRQLPIPVAAEVAAGARHPVPLHAGTAHRIYTGAPLPPGADAVVIQENCEVGAHGVRFLADVTPGSNVRRRGEDILEGRPLLAAGRCVGPGAIGCRTAQGITQVEVRVRPRVSIVTTGDELVEPHEVVQPGQVPNSNAYMLEALVRQAGGEPQSWPIVRDDPAALTKALGAAAATSDLLLTCGGVSVGDHDHVREVVAALGQVSFWKVAIKPGKPLAFGRVHGVPLVGLPGNPVSTFVGFYMFAWPAIRRRSGAVSVALPRVVARLATPHVPDTRRRELVRASLDLASMTATLPGRQGSADQSSLLATNALLDVPPSPYPLPAGAEVPAYLLCHE